jgi:hypothetical protein
MTIGDLLGEKGSKPPSIKTSGLRIDMADKPEALSEK